MSELGSCFERDDLGGGRYRHVQHLRPIAYLANGAYQRIVSAWADSGMPARPHIVTAAQLMVSIADDGMRRIHPTREVDRYAEIGPPYAYIAGSWQKVAFSGATRTGNTTTWHRAQADLSVTHGGHFIKMDIELLGGYVPPNGQFAFPVGLTGLTRTGGTIYRDGVPVMSVRAPSVHDAANVEDVRPIASQFVQVAGQWYVLFTLPSLAGMSRPVVDPTLVLQPDAAAGDDTFIRGGAFADTNYGTDNLVAKTTAGDVNYTRYALIRWPLSTTLPSAANIITCSMTVTSSMAAGYQSCTVNLYRCLRAWVEGQATWNIFSTGNNWGTAGALNSSTDYDGAIVLASVTVPDADAGVQATFSGANLTARAIADLASSMNLLLRNQTDSKSFFVGSSDHATDAYRPKLTIEYSLGGGRLRRAWRR